MKIFRKKKIEEVTPRLVTRTYGFYTNKRVYDTKPFDLLPVSFRLPTTLSNQEIEEYERECIEGYLVENGNEIISVEHEGIYDITGLHIILEDKELWVVCEKTEVGDMI